MKSEKLLREVFVEAAEIENSEARAAYLDEACDGDEAFRERVESLLAFDSQGELPEISEPFSPVFEPELGLLIGPYKLLERIGEGGCGVVYMAEQDKPVRRRVALKIIKLGMDTKQVIARFEVERQVLAMMDHPNIAKVFDAGATETGRPYFVMELVRGMRITDYCDEATMPPRARLELFIRVCQAVQHAHQKGIIHRDLKPSNILVTEVDSEPTPKIIDFGIAKAIEDRLTEQTLFTRMDQLIGTPAYMSPEQATSNTADIDTRTDIYSLGVLLYELLSGQTPFDVKALMASGVEALRRTIQEKEPQRPSTRLSGLAADRSTSLARSRGTEPVKLTSLVKGDLDWIVMKCLEKDRKRRYETANSLAMDVQRHLANEPIVARPASTTYRMLKTWNRHRTAFAFSLAVAAALVLGTIISVWQAMAARSALVQADAERRRANFQTEKAQANEENARGLLYASNMNLARQALVRHDFARARQLLDWHRPQPDTRDLRGWEWRYLWQESRYDPLTVLAKREERGFSVDVAPDGSTLAVGWFSGKVEIWDSASKRILEELPDVYQEGQNALPAKVAFAPHGNLLATSSSQAVMLHDLDSGERTILWQPEEQGVTQVRDMAFSADSSRLVLFTEFEGEKIWAFRVRVIRIATGKVESEFKTQCNFNVWFGSARLSPDNTRVFFSHTKADSGRCRIRCHDLSTGTELWSTDEVEDRGVSTMDISPDGRFLATGSGFADTSIRIWDTETGELVERLNGHTSWIGDLEFSKDGQWLISASADQSIRLWDTSSWKEIRAILGQNDEVHACAYSQSMKLLVSAGKGGNLILWPLEAGERKKTQLTMPLGNGNRPDDLTPLADYKLLTFPPSRPPERVDLKSNSDTLVLEELGQKKGILSIGPNWICRWDSQAHRLLVHALEDTAIIGSIPLSSRPQAAIYSPGRGWLAWVEGTSPTAIHVQLLRGGEPKFVFENDISGPMEFRSSDHGTYLTGGSRESLRVWNVQERRLVLSSDLDTLNQRHGDAAVNEQSNMLVVALVVGEDHEIRFHDLSDPDAEPIRHPGRFIASQVVISSDNRVVAAPTQGGIVRLFHMDGGGWFKDLKAHRNSVSAVVFSPDGRRLITRGKSIKLWDVDTWQELLRLPLSGRIRRKMRISADGHVIVGGPNVWWAPTLEEIDSIGTESR